MTFRIARRDQGGIANFFSFLHLRIQLKSYESIESKHLRSRKYFPAELCSEQLSELFRELFSQLSNLEAKPAKNSPKNSLASCSQQSRRVYRDEISRRPSSVRLVHSRVAVDVLLRPLTQCSSRLNAFSQNRAFEKNVTVPILK